MKKKINALKKKLEKLQDKREELLQDHMMLDMWMDDFEPKNKTDRHELDSAVIEFDRLENKIEELNEELEDLEDEISELEELI